MKLEGKVAVITGAAQGIGKAMALRFAGEGAKVVIGDLNEEAAAQAAKEITDAGGEATIVVGDCATREGADALVERATSKFGRLDIVCNNAGVLDGLTPCADTSDELWDKVIRVNMTGPMLLCRSALPVMLEQGSGVILNTASVAAEGGGRGGFAYTASKHGVNGITRSIAWYYGKKGIRCNAIEPGAVMTPMAMNMKAHQGGMEAMAPYLPIINRYGDPKEIANAALFLASDDASYINGSILKVDGGWTLF